MGLSEVFGNPDDGPGFKSCEVGQNLAQIGVIGLLELVLDQDEAVGGRIPGETAPCFSSRVFRILASPSGNSPGSPRCFRLLVGTSTTDPGRSWHTSEWNTRASYPFSMPSRGSSPIHWESR